MDKMDFKEKINEIKAAGLSWGQIAEALGYSGQKKTYDIGHGAEGMSGPAQTALEYLAQGFLSEKEKKILPEFILGDSGEDTGEILIRLHWPRFVGIVCSESELGPWLKELETVTSIEDEVIAVAFWIDRPLDKSEETLKRAAQFLNRVSS